MLRFPDYKETLALASRPGRPACELENERHGNDHFAVGAMLVHGAVCC